MGALKEKGRVLQWKVARPVRGAHTELPEV